MGIKTAETDKWVDGNILTAADLVNTIRAAQGYNQEITSSTTLSNGGYLVNSSTDVDLQLPTTAEVGDMIKIVNKGTGAYKITQADAENTIVYLTNNTTKGTGGFIQSSEAYTSLELIYINVSQKYFQLNNASYDTILKDVSTEANDPYGTFFKPDGTKLYIMNNSTYAIYQYSLSTAWDVSTATYDTVSFSFSDGEGNSFGIFFKPDGTKLYIAGRSGNALYQYSLSTAWDVSTITFDKKSAIIPPGPSDIFWKPDGTKFFTTHITGNFYEWTPTTAWDIGSITRSVDSSLSTQDGTPISIHWKSDGLFFWMLGSDNNTVYQYSVSTAWSISSFSYDSLSFSVASQDTAPSSIFVKPVGDKFYIAGRVSDSVHQYSSSTAINKSWQVTNIIGTHTIN